MTFCAAIILGALPRTAATSPDPACRSRQSGWSRSHPIPIRGPIGNYSFSRHIYEVTVRVARSETVTEPPPVSLTTHLYLVPDIPVTGPVTDMSEVPVPE